MPILVISLSSLVFFLAVAFDIIPQIRGPSPYPPEWQWPYQFVNTLNKIWFPLIVITAIIAVILYLEKTKHHSKKREILALLVLIILGFLFQLSVLYFSRSGISVLFHRIANPKLNGYFTASLNIVNIKQFLRDYDKLVLTLPMHTIAHPPGTIIIFFIINKIASLFLPLMTFVNKLAPVRGDVRILWLSLAPYQRLGSLIAGPLFSFLSTLTTLPLYLLGKFLYGRRVALRAATLYLFVPALTLFIPLPDIVFPLFSTTALLFFLTGLKKNQSLFLVLSGLTAALGIFFTLGILPIVFLSLLLFIFDYLNGNKGRLKLLISYLVGLILPFLLLDIFFRFNIVKVGITIMKGGIAHRSYLIWLIYNLWDFFIFAGIPVLIIFLFNLRHSLKKISSADYFLWSYSLMLLVLNISGASRAETGRIWLLFIPPLVLLVANFLTKNLKFSSKILVYILLWQAAQVLVMQEFWVTLW